jgi:hypothetical protein
MYRQDIIGGSLDYEAAAVLQQSHTMEKQQRNAINGVASGMTIKNRQRCSYPAIK